MAESFTPNKRDKQSEYIRPTSYLAVIEGVCPDETLIYRREKAVIKAE